MGSELASLGIYGLTDEGRRFAAHQALDCRTRVCLGDTNQAAVAYAVRENRDKAAAARRLSSINGGKSASKGNGKGKEDKDEDADELAAEKAQLTSKCTVGSTNLEEFAARISRPRRIILFGTQPDDGDGDAEFVRVWGELSAHLDDGDAILRWGDEGSGDDALGPEAVARPGPRCCHYSASVVGSVSDRVKRRRDQEKDKRQIPDVYLLEMVRLEMDRTAVRSPEFKDAFLVGGNREIWSEGFEPHLTEFANGIIVGNSARSAHCARMVQRSVEFAVSQPTCEGYDLLKRICRSLNQDVARTFLQWNEGSIASSYLVEITSRIFYKRDALSSEGHVVDAIVDAVDLKASDTWTVMEATKLGVPAPTLGAALEARFFSAMREDRREAGGIVGGPCDHPNVSKEQIADDLQRAIYCTAAVAYAEGLSVLLAASDAEGWDVDLAAVAGAWNVRGSFLASELIEKVRAAFEANSELGNLVADPTFASEIGGMQMAWRRIVALCVASGVPCASISAALGYYDSLRNERMPTALFRAQRDFFGAVGYDRVDREGRFSCCWTKEHTAERRKRKAHTEAKEAEDAAVSMVSSSVAGGGGAEATPPKKKVARVERTPPPLPPPEAGDI